MESVYVGILVTVAILGGSCIIINQDALLRLFKNWRAKKKDKYSFDPLKCHEDVTDRDRHDISIDAAVLDRMSRPWPRSQLSNRNIARGTVSGRISSIEPNGQGQFITKEGLEVLKKKLEKELEEKTIEEFDPSKRVIR